MGARAGALVRPRAQTRACALLPIHVSVRKLEPKASSIDRFCWGARAGAHLESLSSTMVTGPSFSKLHAIMAPKTPAATRSSPRSERSRASSDS